MALHTLLFEFRAMGGPCSLHLRGNDTQHMESAARAAIAEVRRIETKYSRYAEDSVVSRINRNAGTGATEVDEETRQLLVFADQLWQLSDGLFDITSGVLRRAWNFRSDALPTPAALSAALDLIGWQQVRLDGHQVRLARRGMELDFGGFGKEYAVDRAAVTLREAGITDALVNLGGDLHAIHDTHATGAAWQIDIQHPRPGPQDPMASVAHVSLESGGLATSGDYERFIEVEGKRYCHILHPKTGWPVNRHQSISVLAPNATAAGALTTIAMLKEDNALAWLESQQALFLCVGADGGLRSNTDVFQPRSRDLSTFPSRP